jgi:hypothetical protein
VDAIEQIARALHPEAFASRIAPARRLTIAAKNSANAEHEMEEVCPCTR